MRTLVIILLFGFASCNSAEKKSAAVSSVDSAKTIQGDKAHVSVSSELKSNPSGEMEGEQQQISLDSINSVRTLLLALKIANGQKEKDTFSLQSDTLSIRYGNVFSPAVKHLLITRNMPYGVYTNIYILKNGSFLNVCSKDINPLTFVGDTIRDVNGDGRADYLFHWYPLSGCCLRDIYDVYLQKPDGDFTRELEFINPNFSSGEKIIRGLCYGWSAPLYKYKWNGYEVDTIEFIYLPDETNENRIIRRKTQNENERGEVLKKIPEEYSGIER